jgi:hypothetical protein
MKQYGGVNSEEEYSALGLGPIVPQQSEETLRRMRYSSPPEDNPGKPAIVVPGEVVNLNEPRIRASPLNIIGSAPPSNILGIESPSNALERAPPPSYVPDPLPIRYSREGTMFRTASNKLRNMRPIISNYLERPVKIPVTTAIKNKQVKVISAHGSIKKDTWLLIPEGVKIITFGAMGCSVRGETDKSHLESILELYLSGGSLFKEDDEREKEKTVEMDEILAGFSDRGKYIDKDEYNDAFNYEYKLHKENTIFPETTITFDGDGCSERYPDINCAIITFNKLTCRALTDVERVKEEIIHFIPDSVKTTIKLSDLIKKLGKGLYILFTCRVFDMVETVETLFKDRFYSHLDIGRHKLGRKIIESPHNVLTFNVTINENQGKKDTIERFIDMALYGKNPDDPHERITLFKELYDDYDGDSEIDEINSLNIIMKKYKEIFLNLNNQDVNENDIDINEVVMLNKTIFSLLEVGQGLKLVDGKECLDRRSVNLPLGMVPQYVKFLILKIALLKDT